ncbi:MAG: hypothetical protein EA378_10100 [Phycisphaerales bacterium]|nr:MAG: hypothetical protein EA378_10100 [Phycisphaerales bacterium]
MKSTSGLAVVLVGVLLVALGLGGLLLVGCGDQNGPSRPASDVWTEAGGARVYTVRGQVVQLPTSPTTEFQVRHEAIPDFEDRNGETVGMNVMIMPFPLARGVSIESYEIGDKIEIEMGVNWTQTPAWAATRIRKLPDDTALDWTPLE